jgi:DNA-binding transcriptional LysR family regulator
MDTHKYEVFLKVVELGSLTKAAELMGYTQPGISQIIKKLEDGCGFQLLHRGRSGAEPTSDGKRMIPVMRELVKWNEQFFQTASLIKGLKVGKITIASYTSMAYHWIPRIIRRFKDDYPEIDIEMMEGGSQEIETWIKDKTVDIGFLSARPSQEFDVLTLKKDKVLAILPEDHLMSKLKVFPLSAFGKEPFIISSAEFDIDCYNVAKEYFSRFGKMPDIKYTVTSASYTIISMVENGLGLSVLPELLLKDHLNRVVAINIAPEFTRTLIMGVASVKELSPAAAKFIDYVKDFIKEEATLS